jgi:hypothetical protein
LGKFRNVYKILGGIYMYEREAHLGDLDMDGRIILKYKLKKCCFM